MSRRRRDREWHQHEDHGLAVALLILKSAVELAAEVVRSLGDEEVDVSHYQFGLVEKYQQFRQAQLCDWMLYVIEKGKVRTRAELVARGHQALDFSDNPMLRELGLAEQPWAGEVVEQSVGELFERGWLAGEERLGVTDAGREHLGQRMGGTRGEMHRMFDAGSTHARAHAGRRRR